METTAGASSTVVLDAQPGSAAAAEQTVLDLRSALDGFAETYVGGAGGGGDRRGRRRRSRSQAW